MVIPTTGRPELGRAVRSALDQVGPDGAAIDVQVVVVNDSEDRSAADGVPADVVRWTGGRRGGAHARNVGVRHSRGRHVAFLDDDDEWLPGKLAAQLAAIGRAADPGRTVVSGRHVHVRGEAAGRSAPVPTVVIAPGRPVAHYLFRRRSPAVGRASLYTSTLLCPRDLALAVPWREDLSRHQDWDWMVRLERDAGVRFVHVPDVVVRIQTGSSRSISSGADWAASLAWAQETLDDDPAVYVDFVVGQSLRYALNARSLTGAAAVLRSVAVRRRIPAAGPAMIGLAGLVPRPRLERMMTRSRGSRADAAPRPAVLAGDAVLAGGTEGEPS